MNFSEAIKNQWINYYNYNGRASRSEFGYWCISVYIIESLLLFFAEIFPPIKFIAVAFVGATLCPTICVSIRRLHDCDLSGWFVGFAGISISNVNLSIISIVILLIMKGTEGKNRFDAPAGTKIKKDFNDKVMIFFMFFSVIVIILYCAIPIYMAIQMNSYHH